VEERADREIEECVATHLASAEERVATLLETEERARLGVARERHDLVESQGSEAVPLEESPEQAMDHEELSHDLDESGLGRSHAAIIPPRFDTAGPRPRV
jgi:uncharacterized membrane protein